MEEQPQQQPTPQPEGLKKKLYKKWWVWVIIVIVITALWMLWVWYALGDDSVTDGTNGLSVSKVNFEVCDLSAEWVNTPCTDDNKVVTKQVIDTIVQPTGDATDQRFDYYSTNVVSWQTDVGRIYGNGCLWGPDNNWSFAPSAYAQVFLNSACPIIADGSDYGEKKYVYFNAKGEQIAICMDDYTWGPQICEWLVEFDIKSSDYCFPSCETELPVGFTPAIPSQVIKGEIAGPVVMEGYIIYSSRNNLFADELYAERVHIDLCPTCKDHYFILSDQLIPSSELRSGILSNQQFVFYSTLSCGVGEKCQVYTIIDSPYTSTGSVAGDYEQKNIVMKTSIINDDASDME